MASGIINVTTNNERINGYISWSSTPNTEGNYSDVYAEMRLSRNNTGFTTAGTGTWYMSFDSSTTSLTAARTITYNSNTFIIGYKARIAHDANGAKTITIKVTGGISSTSYSLTYGSGPAILDTIPRASRPTLSASTVDMGSSIVINTNRVSNFTHTLSYSFGSANGVIAEGVGDNVTWDIPISLANQIPNSTSGNCTISCNTYSNGTLIGTKITNVILTVPSSVVPTFTTITPTEISSAVNSANVGKFVQKNSNIRLTITGASGIYSSTITGYTITYNGTNYNSNVIDTGTIGWYGDLVVTGKVTDSRGRTASASITLHALAYNVPAISTFSVKRCDSTGTENEAGSYAKIVRCGSATGLLNITEKNVVAAKVWSKLRNSTTWTENPEASVASTSNISNGIDSTPIIISGYTPTSSYDFKFELTDIFTTSTSLAVLSTATVVMSWSQMGVGIGKVWEQGALDIAGNAYINGNTVWNSGNDGAGSGLDADMLDGNHASAFAPSSGIEASAISDNSKSGNGTKLVTASGAVTSGNLVSWDENGNAVDSGFALPIGSVLQYAGSSAPNGYKLCDGSAISRTTYSALYSVIGTTYGTGDGSTTFNVPNIKGRVVVGYNSSDTSFDTLGEIGGEKIHTLVASEMPSHAHGLNRRIGTPPSSGGNGDYLPFAANSGTIYANGSPVQYAGGSSAHNNLQPFIVLNFIIKT